MENENFYSFKELKEKYNWEKDVNGVPAQISYAKNNGVIIEYAFKKGITYFKVIRDNIILYTFDELISKFNWEIDVKSFMSTNKKISFAKGQGLIIEERGYNKNAIKVFEIVENLGKKNDFTIQELENKFNWKITTKTEEEVIKFAKSRGVEIEKLTYIARPLHFFIKNNNIDNQEWKECFSIPNYEVSRDGKIRDKETKRIFDKSLSTYGYVQIKNPITGKFVLAHRLILQTFNPTNNFDNMVVDHINGIKTDNRVENLQWLTSESNTQKAYVDRKDIKETVNKIIAIKGYEETSKILIKILEEIQ